MPPEDPKPSETTDPKPNQGEGGKPPAERLHKLRVNRQDVEVPYDELVRQAQIGMAAESLQKQKEDFRKERKEADALKALVEKINAREDAATIMQRVETAVLADKPLDLAGLVPEPEGDGGDGGEGRKATPARTQTDPRLDRLEKTLEMLVASEQSRADSTARTARQKRIETALGSDPVLKDAPEYAALADSLVPGLMAEDPDLKLAEAEALAIDKVRSAVAAQTTKKHATRVRLRDEFPVAPRGGGPMLSSEEKFDHKDQKSGKVREAVHAARMKFFGGT